jgi:hypothetical protein
MLSLSLILSVVEAIVYSVGLGIDVCDLWLNADVLIFKEEENEAWERTLYVMSSRNFAVV